MLDYGEQDYNFKLTKMVADLDWLKVVNPNQYLNL